MRYDPLASVLLASCMAGCAAERTPTYWSDRGPPDAALLAECNGEVATALVGVDMGIVPKRRAGETIFAGCMGRHGFTAR